MDSISCEEIFRMTQQVWTPMLSFPLKLKPERPTELHWAENLWLEACLSTEIGRVL